MLIVKDSKESPMIWWWNKKDLNVNTSAFCLMLKIRGNEQTTFNYLWWQLKRLRAAFWMGSIPIILKKHEKVQCAVHVCSWVLFPLRHTCTFDKNVIWINIIWFFPWCIGVLLSFQERHNCSLHTQRMSIMIRINIE